MARQRPAESWNRTEEAPTNTSSASASLWEREARDGRKRGDVKTIRAKKPPIEALYPELPARRPNKG